MSALNRMLLIPVGVISPASDLGKSKHFVSSDEDGSNIYVRAVVSSNGKLRPANTRDLRKQSAQATSYYSPPSMNPSNPKRDFVPLRHVRNGIIFKEPKQTDRRSPYTMYDGWLQSALGMILDNFFKGDTMSMAEIAEISRDDLSRYLRGEVPKEISTVEEIAARLCMDRDVAMAMWDEDALEAVEFLYPISDRMPPQRQEFTRLVRLATLRLAGGLNPVRSALRNVGMDDTKFYQSWIEAFRGKPRRILSSRKYAELIWETVPWIVQSSGIATFAETAMLIEEIRSEESRLYRESMEIPMGSAEEVVEQAAYWPVFEDVERYDPFEAVAYTAMMIKIDETLQTLTPREEKVLRLRFGATDTGGDHTLKKTADVMDTTKDRIAQIEAKALRKLRRPGRAKLLRSFVGRLEDMDK